MAENEGSPVIYIVSGGVGASGEQVVHTLLAQFPDDVHQVVTISNVRDVEQLQELVAGARPECDTIVHTLVDGQLCQALVSLADERRIPAFDLMGPLIERISEVTGREPLGQPGLYRKLRKDYYERVAAIEYTMAHDDGQRPNEWDQAEIVLVGVSRVGKTPLSLYLSVLGWKVANCPYVKDVPLNPKLSQLDRRQVVGITMEPGQLLEHRRRRQSRLGVSGFSEYADPEAIHDELTIALEAYRRLGFRVIDVTDKPIETSADEVIRLITSRTGKRG
jgi:regulator of PEP synthase PpsR (kinase-PPPase family)